MGLARDLARRFSARKRVFAEMDFVEANLLKMRFIVLGEYYEDDETIRERKLDTWAVNGKNGSI